MTSNYKVFFRVIRTFSSNEVCKVYDRPGKFLTSFFFQPILRNDSQRPTANFKLSNYRRRSIFLMYNKCAFHYFHGFFAIKQQQHIELACGRTDILKKNVAIFFANLVSKFNFTRLCKILAFKFCIIKVFVVSSLNTKCPNAH